MSESAEIAAARLSRAILSDRLNTFEQAAGGAGKVDAACRLQDLARKVADELPCGAQPGWPSLARLAETARRVGLMAANLIPMRL